jgi:hypothetical protein
MEQLIQRCAGIDVGQAESMVCVRVPDAVTGAPAELIANYATTTPDLLELVDWLRGLGVSDVAMESTGVYWDSAIAFTVLPARRRPEHHFGQPRSCQGTTGPQIRLGLCLACPVG